MSDPGKTSLIPSDEDKRFYKFIVGWAQRYLRTRGRRVVLGVDFIIDFSFKAIHPTTERGRDFSSFVKGEFPKLASRKRIERLG